MLLSQHFCIRPLSAIYGNNRGSAKLFIESACAPVSIQFSGHYGGGDSTPGLVIFSRIAILKWCWDMHFSIRIGIIYPKSKSLFLYSIMNNFMDVSASCF